ncbi:SPFH domain-containing protein [Nocardia sp. NPDC050793]|uniref:SPFH domain-containing protein n=1 Tax=Nocardia sp. NPDC050793 TaxID=3155159 RepID=UPI0033D8CC54
MSAARTSDPFSPSQPRFLVAPPIVVSHSAGKAETASLSWGLFRHTCPRLLADTLVISKDLRAQAVANAMEEGMAWFEREFIAVPEERKNQLVYKWPDVNIRRFSRIIVNTDEIALFVDSGHVTDVMGPGRHRVDTAELPGLGAVIDRLTGSNAYRAELYFLRTREFPGNRFGGRIDDIPDPHSQQVVTLRVFGEYAIAVREPSDLVSGLIGSVDLADPDTVPAWCSDILMRSMKVAVTQGILQGRWPILGLSAHLAEVDTAVREVADRLLSEYGVRITRLGNFDINLAPEDTDRIKRLAKDRTYIDIAGGFQPYAAGELALGAGHGLSRTDAGGFLGAALGLSTVQQLHTQAADNSRRCSGSDDAASTSDSVCTGCGCANPAGARFCHKCGNHLVAIDRRCHRCGNIVPATARFCGECGTAVPP